jgi:uncharacterized protein (DUF2126 family)/transglutaminase-like putative cysteine protease
MTIRVKLFHSTTYRYDRPVMLGPQTVRLRPAPHCRTPIPAYSLKITPSDHYINWQQDPHGNFLARLLFEKKARALSVVVDLTADMTVINPFEFFLEEAEQFPFTYCRDLADDLGPFLYPVADSELLQSYRQTLDCSPRRTIDFLVHVNQQVQADISYIVRMEPGVQTPDQTLTTRTGSCRDSAWLLVHLLRSYGLAARFVSGYLIQLVPDVKPLDGPEGPQQDFTDLHAWAEVYLPGAGWVGLDPTSGLFAGEGHIPLAATPAPQTAAPISGEIEPCGVEFEFQMQVTRVHEDPRVTKPYSEQEWSEIDALGSTIDGRLQTNDVRLTMGGEPTFVSIDDMEGDEWTTAAAGVLKQQLSDELVRRLCGRFAKGALLHYGQGKWYPGEPLPRWAYSCIWREDGEPLWNNPALLAAPLDVTPTTKSTAESTTASATTSTTTTADAEQIHDQVLASAAEFSGELSRQIGVDPAAAQTAYEDVFHILELEQRLPPDLDPTQYDVDSDLDRRRLARALSQGLSRPVGFVLPLTRAWWQADARWATERWDVRSDRVYLIPGDSPLGLRLPLESLPVSESRQVTNVVRDPTDNRRPLPGYAELRRAARELVPSTEVSDAVIDNQRRPVAAGSIDSTLTSATADDDKSSGRVIRTALCIEPRNGQLHVFMPPTRSLEDYLDLVACVEATADKLQTPVVVEGYLPPTDHRIRLLKVTPDPGVIEVNVHPARNWKELTEITRGVYEEARHTRLGTEKFQLDGRHSGTGGGNHLVLGGSSPEDSPFLRRPDLLRSVIGFWNNHPSLSYLFSGLFIGPTSQSPRLDEGRRDSLCEMEIAFRQIPDPGEPCRPWLVDRVFRNLLIDLTGNTHRAEICIDKLYSPDHTTGRLGLVELRAFEMPPHVEMSLTQQLLVRALVCAFWEQPYREPLIHWRTAIHDRFMMPCHLWDDLSEIVEFLAVQGIHMKQEWFAPHFEFRCPLIGRVDCTGMTIELRQALEPWHVLGEQPGGGGTTRYVDSSLERLQVLVRGAYSDRYCLTVNGIRIPLKRTATPGELVGAVRYRAWQPPRCLQPSIKAHAPLTFDVVDTAQNISLGGCQYHVDHPGGVNSESFPVNALEAESRRAARFFPMGHTGGRVIPQTPRMSPEFPCTLDLRLGIL